ncbi:hypothetical protein [Polyangium aurulentum]|uniref:hypothetical protein n=1 Tax=Polyangium aurulentum TaxID=2567896 RepID=UPI0010ADF520|nr:hypothetical protein [Polyangium aurulentum]UQA60323.1 hypothetical protein E8A73_007565 [Polyangium aurulentum]
MEAEMRAERGGRTFGILAMQWASLALVSLAVACSSSPSNPGGAGGEGGWGEGASGGMGNTGGMGGGGGSAPSVPEIVVPFDPFKGELPEGLAIEGTTAYVSLSVLNTVITIDLETGARGEVGSINAQLGIGFTQGVVVDKGIVYAAALSEDTAQFKPGIYKFTAGNMQAELFGSHGELIRPRGLAIDANGDMLITEPRLGALFSMAPATGMVEKLGAAPELYGDPASACKSDGTFLTGVQGLFVTVSGLYFSNADRATIYQIGKEITPFAGPDCATLGGADGMVGDIDGSMIVAVPKANLLARVKFNGQIETLMKDDLLHEPTSVAIATVGGKRYLYWVNSARTTFKMGGLPGLGRMPLDG